MSCDDLDFSKKILFKESFAISDFANSLDESFLNAINLICSSFGNVVMSGVGKSGNVAAKIASTFSSTGTRAFFLHPTDASHGDLGMLHNNDVAIILSVSGNTVELFNLIKFIRDNSIKLIAITADDQSVLAVNADVVIKIKKYDEAGELKLAPSVSSTLMLAIGDALALTVSRKKGFSKADFLKYHPGGSLGESLKKDLLIK